MSARSPIVIVGASLAGLRAAESLRQQGYDGAITLIGDEPHRPYDRPPLSKQVLSGWVRPGETALPRARAIAAEWRLGAPAVGIDRALRTVQIRGGETLAFDKLIIATGVRARAWRSRQGAPVAGVHTLRTRDDAGRLLQALDAVPKRVLVIGAGFLGSEIASACRDRGLAVTVVEAGPTPLWAAIGPEIGAFAADLQLRAGVDLRCGLLVTDIVEADGKVVGARLSDGSEVETDLIVACLGSIRNCEWLEGAGLSAGPDGVLCDTHCRVLAADGAATADILACGDVCRFPHPLAGGEPIALEHWGNAVDQAGVAAANALRPGTATCAGALPSFWSMQFGVNIKSVGLPSRGDQVMVTQGSMAEGRFAAVYGRGGRMVGAVTIDHAKWLEFYAARLAEGAPFPPDWRLVGAPAPAVAPLTNPVQGVPAPATL